jgi:plastocyanin
VIEAVALLTLLVPSGAGAVTKEVTVHDSFDGGFDPSQVDLVVGDVVRWSRDPTAAERHNVRQRKELFLSGPASDDPAWEYQRTFSAGKFAYNCTVHPVQMTGSVWVSPRMEAAPDGLPFTVRWATSNTNTGRVFDVRYRVDGGSWRIWKTDTSAFRAVFGKDRRPVRVLRGHTYDFGARSQKRDDTPRLTSGWSPTLTVTT